MSFYQFAFFLSQDRSLYFSTLPEWKVTKRWLQPCSNLGLYNCPEVHATIYNDSRQFCYRKNKAYSSYCSIILKLVYTTRYTNKYICVRKCVYVCFPVCATDNHTACISQIYSEAISGPVEKKQSFTLTYSVTA